MTRRHLVVLAATLLILVSCGGDASSPDWTPVDASATTSLDDGTTVTFTGGTCESGVTSSGSDSFVLRVGEPGADGEGLLVRIGLDLAGGATFAGDGSGNGVQLDHAGSRWGLAEGSDALLFDDDLSGGTIQIAGIATLGEDADPRTGTVDFEC